MGKCEEKSRARGAFQRPSLGAGRPDTGIDLVSGDVVAEILAARHEKEGLVVRPDHAGRLADPNGVVIGSLIPRPRLLILVVRDDGIGLPRHLDIHRSATLGLSLVQTLVQQINGCLAFDRTGGTAVEITFVEDPGDWLKKEPDRVGYTELLPALERTPFSRPAARPERAARGRGRGAPPPGRRWPRPPAGARRRRPPDRHPDAARPVRRGLRPGLRIRRTGG